MRNLIATKPFVYATRRLKAGDGFIARSGKDERVLVALGKATRCVASADAPVEPKREQHDVDSAIRDLRTEYKALTGKPPFMGWNVEQLTKKIAAAKAKG
ncbi:hypothetical protein SAMN03159423_4860 [Bradyrhizobium sp. NFR13]|uniref:hypothetical protein n=1 Tax=Bradyrhizobium sp. NFR13 TaxID=1566285 RepID=UPI0008E4DE5A|nr:hypothetical protein [Bradyrhizobium sp. NFR13]SFM00489.1 hypothetical protein SAMN03159423_4860 [Bradyrhizobium sp. NFR13]